MRENNKKNKDNTHLIEQKLKLIFLFTFFDKKKYIIYSRQYPLIATP